MFLIKHIRDSAWDSHLSVRRRYLEKTHTSLDVEVFISTTLKTCSHLHYASINHRKKASWDSKDIVM